MWNRWRRLFRRLGIVIPAAIMVTLLLIAIDWAPLGVFHQLLSVAWILLVLLWFGIAIGLVATAITALASRSDRLELEDGVITRHLMFNPRMRVRVDGATISHLRFTVVVRGAGGKGRVFIPQLFYAREDVDRLLAAAGLGEDAPGEGTQEKGL